MPGSRSAAISRQSNALSTDPHVRATVRRVFVPRPSILNPYASILAAVSVFAAPLVFVTACTAARYSTEPGAPTLVLPAHFAEGQGEPGATSARPASSSAPLASGSAAPAGSAGSATDVPVAPALTPSTAPDPAALRMAEQVEYELELNEGKVHVVSVKALKLPSPIVTARKLGRYAIELRIGPELIERVRFDFPGTAADEPEVPGKKKLYAPLTLGARAIARVKLLVPQSPRVRQAVLVDRALSTATALEWPLPDVAKAAPGASASAVSPLSAAPPASAAPKTTAAPSGSASPKAQP